ncbi:MAG: hypothetical protein M1834_001494 [Cirrosporium novae-zelandiae]|nr:MAG: hypothetical protein M1834_001494 [Cirrosporium novae-zelandiae]
MKLLSSHLEQISQSAAGIAELPFPPPKIFSNALLRSHDITTLIRDTEAHERALFSYAPLPFPTSTPSEEPSRRATVFQINGSTNPFATGSYGTRAPRRNTAVARVLGGDMMDRIEKSGGAGIGRNTSYSNRGRTTKGEMDVELLLEGAEKLCAVYPMPGAAEKIDALRARYQQLSESISQYEAGVRDQASQLERMYRSQEHDSDQDMDPDNVSREEEEVVEEFTKEDIMREEEEIRELEKKKASLQERVSGMERDLGGLMR